MRAIRRFTASSSFFIGLLFSTMVLVGIFFVFYFLVLSNNDIFLRESEAAIDVKMQQLQQLEQLAGIDAVSSHLTALQADDQGYLFAMRAPGGPGLLLHNIPFWPSSIETTYPNGMILFEISNALLQHSSQSTRLRSEHYDVMARTYQFASGHELLVGRNIDDLEIAQWVGSTFGWLMIALLLSISLISFAVAYYVVTRINRISETADRIIDTGRLSERLPVDNSWDDLSKLSLSLNRMFAELEQQVHAIKTVSDNIAHDLRTPLTRIRSKLDPVQPEALKESLVTDVDHLLAMFAGLLRIAELENSQQRSAFALQPVRVIVEDVIELYAPLCEERQQQLSSQCSDLMVICDKDLIFQAIANALDNAVKFTPLHGSIRLELQQDGRDCIIRVTDSGPGISPEDIEKITQRFYRAESSRTTPGFGLGMAMVNAIMQVHQGEVRFVNQPSGGLCCELRFPINRQLAL
ncbi:HAMP domain-containing histidine kinase [Vibrio cholerae]|nr:HAMP domain-containing histidine kinase [Vibrio cholerae]EJB8378475.1 HAMP domain-containing histidine kinase [Vibrio cholerae]